MRSALHTSLLLVLFGTTQMGCLYARGMKAYESPRLQVGNIPPDALYQALLGAISEAGWNLVKASPQRGTVEALAPTSEMAGVLTRERWSFSVDPLGIEVRMRLEAQWEPGDDWDATDHVCLDYSYLRENVFLDAVSQALLDDNLSTDDPWMRLTASVDEVSLTQPE